MNLKIDLFENSMSQNIKIYVTVVTSVLPRPLVHGV